MRILRGLGSSSLNCGCFVGIYETYDGRTVRIVDARGPACANPAHREGIPLTVGHGAQTTEHATAILTQAADHSSGRR
jgi:hypothetical protein